MSTDEENIEPQANRWEHPMSLEGEPQFQFGTAEVGPGVQIVALNIIAGGVQFQVTMRPALALTVAKLLSDQAKHARSGLIIAANGDLPKGPPMA